MEQGPSSFVRTRVEGRAGRITLTRPQALNALDHGMCKAIDAALLAWAEDPAVSLVIIDAEGERAFCAGGDVRSIVELARAGDVAPGRAFFRDEYAMNRRLAGYAKPIVALMQGFVMGGGIGLGGHVSHRVVDDATQFAMPETAIGFVPDVGVSLLLARAPQRIGIWMALTSLRLGASDAVAVGLADHLLAREHWPGLIADLCASGDPGIIAARARATVPGPIMARGAEIASLFAGSDLAVIGARLEAADSDFTREALAAMAKNSPLAQATALALVDGHDPADSIETALKREFRVAFRSCAPEPSDFHEGVRAQLIDKDRQPRWDPPTLDGVWPALIDDHLRLRGEMPARLAAL